jgi:predicted nucleic-acid-binding Zn-ribbon protein
MTDYLIKNNITKEKVDDVLTNFNKKITSNYVRMEFKKGPLQYLIYLHNKIVACRDMAEVHQAIRELSAGYQRNRLSSILEHVEKFFKKYYKSRPSEIIKECGDIELGYFLREKAISFLSNLIRPSWRKFEKVVDELINPMECFIDIQAPYRKGISKVYRNNPRTCEKSPSKCKIREFFNDNSSAFGNILRRLKEIDSPDQETIKRIRSLKKILRVKKREVRVEDCWNCSDAIIAVEAPDEAAIFDNNRRHYDPICEAIGKRSIGYN